MTADMDAQQIADAEPAPAPPVAPPPPPRREYDPSQFVIDLGRGKGQYLQAEDRILWLRNDYPEAVMTQELITVNESIAIFKTTIATGHGGYAEGYGSETPADFKDYIEKAACVPLRSRMLTRRGFVRYDELIVGEAVLAYDHATDRTVWTPLREVKAYAEGAVIALTNRWGYRLECTTDHSWAMRGQNGRYRLREAGQIKTSDRLILAAPAPGGDSTITPTEAAIIGWLFTDGTIKRDTAGVASRGIITQSKPAQIARIAALVGDVATLTVSKPYRARIAGNPRDSDCLPQHLFALPAAITRALFAKAGIQHDGDLPAFVTTLSVEARAAMFAAMMDADGDKKGNFGKKRRPGTMEAWRVLCALQGIATGARRLGSDSGVPYQRARKTRHMMGSQVVIEAVGTRPVWCPTTDYGTWVMEQDGVVTITGNTKSLGRALAALGYGTKGALAEGEVADSPARPPDIGSQGRREREPEGRYVEPRQQDPPRTPRNPDAPASEGQRKMIYALARECGLEAEEMQTWISELTDGRTVTSKELTMREAGTLISLLQARKATRG